MALTRCFQRADTALRMLCRSLVRGDHLSGGRGKPYSAAFSACCASCACNFRVCVCDRHNCARITSNCPHINAPPKLPPMTKAAITDSHVGIFRVCENGHKDNAMTVSFETVKLIASPVITTEMMIHSNRPNLRIEKTCLAV